MESRRFESLALIAAVIGAAALGSQARDIGAVGDVAILLSLFAFDSAVARSGGQSLAFAGTAAFCLLTPFTVLADAISPGSRPYWLILFVWVIATVILFSVDRFRVSSREAVGLAGGLAGAASTAPMSFTPAQQPSYRPAPIRVEQPAPPPPPQPVYQAPQPIIQAPPPVSPAVAPVFQSASVATPVYAAAPVVTAPDATAIPPGREALIYLNLVGEGLNVLRTVRAENLGRDYYRIADVMPEGEQWEFTPGQVVRCRKKSLSNGKHMVAFEEAPRAQ